jgi:ferric-dicitrate binding protein FerR (iron transport regulator)
MSQKWTSASELAEYEYCRRAWWYKNVRELKSTNLRRMQAGSQYHRRHGRRVRRLPWLRGFAYVLIFAAVAVLVFQIIVAG